jgi:phenylalanyl-tRNA synthetase beta subunit
MTLTFRNPEGTLTSEEADALRDRIVAACGAAYGAQLRA